MDKKNNIFRIKIDFEDCPLIKTEAKGIKGLREVMKDIELKVR